MIRETDEMRKILEYMDELNRGVGGCILNGRAQAGKIADKLHKVGVVNPTLETGLYGAFDRAVVALNQYCIYIAAEMGRDRPEVRPADE
jgi:hypothetical protein